jgi:hypothetical protein
LISRKGWGRVAAGSARWAAAMCICVLSISSAAADPGNVELDGADAAAATPVVGSTPELRRSFLARARLARLESGEDERVCRPRAWSGAGPAVAPAVTATLTEFDRGPNSSAVDEYLCGVYWRMPHKVDDAGDFSWKDGAAAERVERTVCDYAINGMHPDLRELLYALGHKADAAGINWSMLSAFRDDYRHRVGLQGRAVRLLAWRIVQDQRLGRRPRGRSLDRRCERLSGRRCVAAARADRQARSLARAVAPAARCRSAARPGQRRLAGGRSETARAAPA